MLSDSPFEISGHPHVKPPVPAEKKVDETHMILMGASNAPQPFIYEKPQIMQSAVLGSMERV